MLCSNRIYLLVAAAAAALLASGCVTYSRHLVALDSHPKAPALAIQSNYWMHDAWNGSTRLVAHEFWSCQEQTGQVLCKRLCGAQAEYTCPGVGRYGE